MKKKEFLLKDFLYEAPKPKEQNGPAIAHVAHAYHTLVPGGLLHPRTVTLLHLMTASELVKYN